MLQGRPSRAAGVALASLAPLLLAGAGSAPDAPLGHARFADRRDPPPFRELAAEPRARYDLGLLIFNTPWVAAGSPGAARIDGVGPLFVSASCDQCHNNGARGRPAIGAEGTSNSFVMQLEGPEPQLYGAVLNTAAIAGHAPEGQVEIRWVAREGRYADGSRWQLREPLYQLRRLLYGPLPDATVLRPRIAPQVFGSGLLERVTTQSLEEIRAQQPAGVRGTLPPGRFGWQAEAVDLEDQTARAFAREMGLSSSARNEDDCTPAQIACRAAPSGGTPEVSDEFLQAIVTYQQELAVPAGSVMPGTGGQRLFERTGCADCHVQSLPVTLDGVAGRIEAWTDLLLHDLGDALADRDVAGRVTASRWRTAPLWGLEHAHGPAGVALLHDGRAASIEEAILWHGGQAEEARRTFLSLSAADRRTLIAWVQSL